MTEPTDKFSAMLSPGDLSDSRRRALDEGLAIPKVKAKEELLRDVASDEWWEDDTVEMLEHARRELRSIVGLLEKKKRVVVYTDFTGTSVKSWNGTCRRCGPAPMWSATQRRCGTTFVASPTTWPCRR